MATDKKKLEQAVKWARGQESIWRQAHHREPASTYMASHYGALAEAAEAHLKATPE